MMLNKYAYSLLAKSKSLLKLLINTNRKLSSSSKEDKIKSFQLQLLTNALLKVEELGFSEKALHQAANELGYPTVSVGVLPNRELDLVEFYMNLARKDSLALIDDVELESLKTLEKIRKVCQIRLDYNKKYINALPQAFALLTTPTGIPKAINQLELLTDAIWYKAGDKSYDMNWYSKRIILGGVYSSTEMFMLQDKSKDFQATYQFLDRRLSEVKDFESISSEISNLGYFGYKSFIGVLESRGVRF